MHENVEKCLLDVSFNGRVFSVAIYVSTPLVYYYRPWKLIFLVREVAQALVAGADQTDKMVALALLPVIQPFIFRVWKIRLVFQLYESPNSGEKIVEVMWNNIMSNNK